MNDFSNFTPDQMHDLAAAIACHAIRNRTKTYVRRYPKIGQAMVGCIEFVDISRDAGAAVVAMYDVFESGMSTEELATKTINTRIQMALEELDAGVATR